MKSKLLFLAALYLLLFAVASQAQQAQPSADAIRQMLQSPMGQKIMMNGVKTGIRSFWEGKGENLMALSLVQYPEIRTALGLSEEQAQQIQVPPTMEMFNNPEFRNLTAEMQSIPNLGELLTGQNVDEEAQNKFLDIQSRMTSLTMNMMADRMDNLLTPEQKKKIQETQLASMSEVPIVSISAFDVLNLSDAQKRQMEDIKKELEPEFEKNLDSVAGGAMIMLDKFFVETRNQGEIDYSNQDAMRERMQAIQKKLMEDPEYKKINDEMQSQSREFSTRLRTKMFDVLTDVQWRRLQELIDNPPAHAALILKKMKEQRGESVRTGNNVWQPGPSSWQPGDAIPEGYRQERNTRNRFPSAQE